MSRGRRVRDFQKISLKERGLSFFSFSSCCLDSGGDGRNLGSNPGLGGDLLKVAEEQARIAQVPDDFRGCCISQDCLPMDLFYGNMNNLVWATMVLKFFTVCS